MAVTDIGRIGVVGLGAMGSGIAQLAIEAGYETVGREVTGELAHAARERIAHFLQRKVDKELMTAAARESALGSLSLTTDLGDLADCDLVIEAIVEDLEPKRELFHGLEGIVRSDSILATNTSALSVTAMGEALEHPERLVGMHFFNPVALMPLVELVRTPDTDHAALATAWAVTDKLRKRPVLVHDAPGFVVNRLLTRMMLVVHESVERGSSVEEADAGVLMLGLPMAPSVLLQMVGEQVATHVRQTLQAAFPDRFVIDPTGPRRSVEEIRDAVLEALAEEVGHLLEEGVVDSPKDVDTALILGAGFPFFMGGLTPYLGEHGYSFALSPR